MLKTQQIARVLNVGLTKKTYICITVALSLWILFYCYQNKAYISHKVVSKLTERKGRSTFNVTGTVKIPWANKFTWTNESNRAADHKIMTEDSGKNDGIISLDPYPLLKYNYYSAPLYTMAPTLRMEVTMDRNAVVNKTVGRIQVPKRVPTWQELETKYVSWNKALLEEALRISMLSGWKYEPLAKLLPQEDTASLGPWRPVSCRPNETVAIILPYRDRELQLRTFLYHMHGFLRHQEVTYTIFVVEQLGRTHFNRGSLLNIGFRESKRVAEFDCFIFHDADLLPEDDRLPYRCRDQPIHLSASLDVHKYTLLYQSLVGGATAFSRTQFEKVRGFSNFFFGWGGEDDNLYNRLKEKGYQVYRYPLNISQYTMLRHEREKLNQPNPIRYELLKHMMGRSKLDGYPESDYKVVDAGYKHKGLVYWISVEIPEKKVTNKFINCLRDLSIGDIRISSPANSVIITANLPCPRNLRLWATWQRGFCYQWHRKQMSFPYGLWLVSGAFPNSPLPQLFICRFLAGNVHKESSRLCCTTAVQVNRLGNPVMELYSARQTVPKL